MVYSFMKISNILSRRNRILLRELVVTDFKLRYQGSVLGYMWSLFKPLFMFAILYVIFGLVLKFGNDIEHFPIYLLLGIVLWGFFVEATSQALTVIVDRGDLLRKINFPKYIVVISGTISALINLFINLIVVGIFMAWNGVELTPYILLFPLNILELYIFALALAFLLSALYVKYRDVSHIWEVFLQAAYYVTPILYPISIVIAFNVTLAQLMLLNPIAQIFQDARYNLVTQQTQRLYDVVHNPFLIAIPFIIVILSIVLASWYFKKHSKYFAENV